MEWKWVTVILGIALFLAPFVTGYSDNSAALWTSLILGVGVTVLGYMKQNVAVAIVGVIIFLAPWILNFDEISSALWSCLLVGGATALVAGYRAYADRKDSEASSGAGSVQHHGT